jgi:hypothetical protein
MTWGTTPNAITWSRPAPTATTPSACPGSIASMVSPRSLPSTPPVWMPSASMPAKGPSPTAVTNMSADELVDRAQHVHRAPRPKWMTDAG